MKIIPYPDKYQMKIMYYVACLPAFYVFIAQSVKRCHDLGNSGWWIIIPFYSFILLLAEGNPDENRYGANPKLPKLIADPFAIGPVDYQVPDHKMVQAVDDVDVDGVLK
jgi:hypothetical protein